MSTRYSHTFVDPDTGQVVDVLVDDDDDGYRNAGPRDHRQNMGGRGWLPPRPTVAMQPRPAQPPARPVYSSPVVVRHPMQSPAAQPSGEYLSIRKAAVAEIIPTAGMLWAAFLGMPGRPIATGDNKIDHDNQTMHAEALARHHQSQERIKAVSDLAGRMIKLFVG